MAAKQETVTEQVQKPAIKPKAAISDKVRYENYRVLDLDEWIADLTNGPSAT